MRKLNAITDPNITSWCQRFCLLLITILKMMIRKRAKYLLGGFCGHYGACAAGVGTGVFISLITEATPLSKQEWKLSNMMTSKSLLSIANVGGPRCCKRTVFLSITEAVNFLDENFGVKININKNLRCEFSSLNKECLREKCPFYYQRSDKI